MPTGPSSSETPFDRGRALRRLASEHFDVLVVGGGITGAGVALDAAARGLRTALVERDDFASGTSSKSSKMVHGGLRYLQHGDIRLVYEALHERQRLLHNAPHLVTPLPFLIPLFGRNGVVSAGMARAYASALWLYDLTGGWRIGRWHRRLSQVEALGHLPALRTDRLVAGFLYFDARVDDARLTLAVARTAVVDFGAVAANYTEAVALRHDEHGTVTGAIVRPRHATQPYGPQPHGTQPHATQRHDPQPHATQRHDAEIEVRARVVVNATGVWADELRSLDEGHHTRTTRPAKGVHVTVPGARLPADIAAVLPVPGDRRSIFVVPWADGDDTYVGTTDTAWDGPLDHPTCTADDVDYLLEAVNAATTAAIERHEVTGVWAGLRPLLDPDARADHAAARALPAGRRARKASERTADLSRKHQVMTSPSGVVTVTGGKLTTYRLMAEDTVDEVVRLLGPRAPAASRRCPTRRLTLRGAPLERTGRLARFTRFAREPRGTAPPTIERGLVPHVQGGAATPGARTAHFEGGGAVAPGARTAHFEGGTELDASTVVTLRSRYGSEWLDVLAMAADRPELLRPLVSGLPYLRVEVLWAATQEMAQSVEDVLSRRTRITLRRAEAAARLAGELAELLAGVLDRPIEELRDDAEAFVRGVRADLARAGIPTRDSDAARTTETARDSETRSSTRTTKTAKDTEASHSPATATRGAGSDRKRTAP